MLVQREVAAMWEGLPRWLTGTGGVLGWTLPWRKRVEAEAIARQNDLAKTR
jgi:hypothetical protein